MSILSILFVGVLLLVSLYTDLKKRVIYNYVTIPVMIVGLFVSGFYAFRTAGITGIIAVALNLLIAFAICESYLVPNGFWAYGDAKLFLACVVWFPPFIGMFAILGLYIAFHFGYNILYRMLKKRNIQLPIRFPGSIPLAMVTIINLILFRGVNY